MNPTIHDGLAHHQAGRLADAERIYRQLLTRRPDDPDALHLLGVIAFQMKQFEPAADLISRAIAIKSDAAIYHNNLGNVMRSMARRQEAVDAYTRALQLSPGYVEAQVNLATGLREQARFGDAVAAYEKAIAMSPSLAEAHGNLGTVFKDQGRIDEAIAAYRRAAGINPTYADARHNLLYGLHFSDAVTATEIFNAHQRWGSEFSGGAQHRGFDSNPTKRLRIGYVSPDFHDHPVARFLHPLIQHHDRTNFEIIAYSNVERPDAVSTTLHQQFDHWHNTAALTHDELATLIRSHEIDILIDLAGHTSGGRLETFALKPAPVQMTYLGYPDTTGLPQMDYRITDALTDPPGAESRHTEKLARLDGCFLSYPFLPLAVSRRPPREVTFASFNNLAKISPTTINLWSRVLASVPNSKMIIKATSLGDAPTRALASERFARQGLPMNRVELLGPAPSQADHLATYARVTVALDTFPYNGTTTTCEALSMGVPVVSLFGEHHCSRVGLSLLSACGLAAHATNDPDQFVQIAPNLATNPPIIQPPPSDGPSFARKIERIYRDAWTAHCDQYNPRRNIDQSEE